LLKILQLLQVMVDGNLKVLWFSCQCTGNTNDSLAFQSTDFAAHLSANPLPDPYCILGEDADKAHGSVVCPYPGANLDEHEDALNFYVSRTRITVERAFGVIKRRWQVFARPSSLALPNFQG
jgi:hypothetical protein